MPRPGRIPSYRLHKPSGLAVVTLSGTDHYLGPHGSEASRAEYDRVVGQWQANGRRPIGRDGSDITVTEVLVGYLKFATGYYTKDGRPTSQLIIVKRVARDLKGMFGPEPAAKFGPMALKTLRQSWVDGGLSRKTVNTQAGVVKRVFRWGVENELVPPSVDHALRAVRQLARGRTEAPDHPPVGIVSDEHVAAVLPLVNPVVAALIRLQDLTGMRPSEAVKLRPCDIDRSGPIWRYTPTSTKTGLADHKTAHHGRGRVILVGPRAQAILAPWIDRQTDPKGYLFRAPSRRGGRRPNLHYTIGSYEYAIVSACRKAGVPHWSPNQLRHSAATRLRKRFGLDAARVVLGHASATITEIYAEMDQAKAAEVAAEIG